MEGFFWGRDLSTNEAQFFRVMRMGILDGREGYNMPMTASTRAMEHTAAVSARLFVMFENERQRVRSLGMSNSASLTRAQFREIVVMDMVKFRTIFFELFSFLHIHNPYPPFCLLTNLGRPLKTRQTLILTAD